MQNIRTALALGEFAKARELRTEAFRDIIREAADMAQGWHDGDVPDPGFGMPDVELMEILDNLGIPDE